MFKANFAHNLLLLKTNDGLSGFPRLSFILYNVVEIPFVTVLFVACHYLQVVSIQLRLAFDLLFLVGDPFLVSKRLSCLLHFLPRFSVPGVVENGCALHLRGLHVRIFSKDSLYLLLRLCDGGTATHV